jgi:hypothetical protein
MGVACPALAQEGFWPDEDYDSVLQLTYELAAGGGGPRGSGSRGSGRGRGRDVLLVAAIWRHENLTGRLLK